MRLSLFLIADLLGCLIFTLIWTTFGLSAGRSRRRYPHQVVDKYALWLTLAIIVGIFVITYIPGVPEAEEPQ